MKNLLLIFCVGSLALGLTKNNKVAPKGAFKDSEKGFTIELPIGWDQQRNVMGASVIAALSPNRSKEKDFQPNLNVVVEKLTQKVSIQEYFDASQHILSRVFQDFKVEKKGEYKTAQTSFKWSLFTHKVGAVKARVKQYITIKDQTAYIITATSAEKTFAEYLPTFEKSVATFKIESSRKITQE